MQTLEWLTAEQATRLFEALTGKAPRDFQVRLAQRIASGNPPDVLHVGTGLGKTAAVLAGWLTALLAELEAGHSPRRVPLRLFVVVDRRVVVDGTYQQAQQLLKRLAESDADILVRARELLAQRFPANGGPGDARVDLVRLRGQLDERAENTRCPARPLIAVGTIDLVLSRLLFRAYLTNPRRRSIEAALTGADSLIVLDEAHLVHQAMTTLGVLQAKQAKEETRFTGSIPARHVMAMTATPRDTDGKDVLEADLEVEHRLDPGLQERLARRRATTYRIDTTQLPLPIALAAAATTTMESAGPGALALVFCTTVKEARTTADTVRAKIKQTSTHSAPRVMLVTGGMPYAAAEQVRDELAPYTTGSAERNGAPPLIVVCTSTLEVGADLDADHLITAPCDATAMVQRAGRVNRVGDRVECSILLVAHTKAAQDPVYGQHGASVVDLLHGVTVLGEALDRLTEASGSSTFDRQAQEPAVLPHHVLRAYTRTVGSRNDPEVAPWLRELQDPAAEVSIVFRDSIHLINDDRQLIEHLRLSPPDTRIEGWTLSLGSVPTVLGVAARGRMLRCDPATAECTPIAGLPAIRPGDVLILAPPTAGTTVLGYDQEQDLSGVQVVDPSEWERTPWSAQKLASVLDDGHTVLLPIDEIEFLERFESWAPDATRRTPLDAGDERAEAWLQVEPIIRTEHDDAQRVELAEHGRDVGETAFHWAKAIGLPDPVCEDLRCAGQWHDSGKCAKWAQIALSFTLDDNGQLQLPRRQGGPLLGKSALPYRKHRAAARLAGTPTGFRHEALSAELLDQALTDGSAHCHDPQLARHLVLTHHGHYRGPGPISTWGERTDTDADGGYQNPEDPRWADAMIQFRSLEDRLGPYTLALAETVLRLADWHVSRGGDTR